MRIIFLILLLPVLVFSQGITDKHKSVIARKNVAGGEPAAYTTEATRYFAAMGTQLADSQKTNINDFVVMLHDSLAIDSLAEFFDVMYLLANETEEAGLLNLVKRSSDGTRSGVNLTFTQWQGFTGNTNLGYIDMNYDARNDGVNYTQNSASFGCYQRIVESGTIHNQMGVYDTTAGGTPLRCFQANPYEDGIYSDRVYINRGSWGSGLDPDVRGLGTKIATRISSSEVSAYINGVGGTVTSNPSEGVPTLSFYVCGYNSLGTSDESTDQISFAFIGASVTATQARQISNCIEAYLDGIGAGVL